MNEETKTQSRVEPYAILREVLAMRDRADQIIKALGGEGYAGFLTEGMLVWYDTGERLQKVRVGHAFKYEELHNEMKDAARGEDIVWGYAPPPVYQFWTTEEDFRHRIISVIESPQLEPSRTE